VSAQYKHIQLKRATQSEFENANPVLKSGEPAFSLDTFDLRIGDGTSKWSDLSHFKSSKEFKCVTATVDVAAINAGEYENINVTVSDIESDNCYAVLISPQVAMPDDVSIDYAYVSSDNTITVKFINRVASVVDGGGGSASTPITDLKLNVMICMTEKAVTVTSTTTTLPPVADDVYSWGGNEFGQLGINSKVNQKVPVFVVDSELWQTFSLGHYHTLGIDSDGKLFSCGFNYYGQLGLEVNGQGTNQKELTYIPSGYFQDGSVYSSGMLYNKVAAGSQYSLAIDNSGVLFAAGGNSHGALGLGNQISKDKFTVVGLDFEFIPMPSTVDDGIDGGNNVFDFGGTNPSKAKYVADGTSGTGSKTYRINNIPAASAVAVLNQGLESFVSYTGGTIEGSAGGYDYFSDFVEIEVSGNYDKLSIATLNDSFLGNGQELFYYDNLNNGWTDISAGNYHSLGIKDSCLYTWGNNSFGQLGNGDNRDIFSPVKIGSKTNWASVAAGNNHSIAVDDLGVAYAFGSNSNGQLGLGDQANRNVLTEIEFDFSNFEDANFTVSPSAIPLSIASYDGGNRYSFDSSYNPLERFVLQKDWIYTLNVPEAHPIAILNRSKTDKITYTGDNNAGCLNVRGTTADGTYDFYWGNVYISVLGDFDKVSAYCFHHGYMGGRNIFYYDQPSYDVVDVDAGVNHTILLTDNDQALTFGQNHKGQLGTGDNLDRSTPYRLPDPSIKSISAGGHHTMMVNSQKYLLNFGDNSYGQLGFGDNVNRNESERLETKVRWQQPFAGGTHSLATVFSYFPSQTTGVGLHNALESDEVGHRQLYAFWNHSTALEEGVTDYKIQLSTDGGTNWVDHADEVSTRQNLILDGLEDASNYIIRVAAVNNIGTGIYISQDPSDSRNPQEASDPFFANTIVYSHLDDFANGMDDLSTTSATVTSGIIDSNAGIDPDGKFSESIRLTERDNIKYSFGSQTFDAGFTLECFFKPNLSVNAPQAQPILKVRNGTVQDYVTLRYEGNRSSGYRFSVVDSGGGAAALQSPYIDIDEGDFAHLAVVRTSGLSPTPSEFNKLVLFVDGEQQDLVRAEGDYVINEVILSSGDTSYFADFSVDEARLTKKDRYESDFTITTKPFGLS
jgi:alpha-tubulin suppressor-like RCC1 family protein